MPLENLLEIEVGKYFLPFLSDNNFNTNKRILDVYEISNITKTVLSAINYCNDENIDALHIASVIEILNDKTNKINIYKVTVNIPKTSP